MGFRVQLRPEAASLSFGFHTEFPSTDSSESGQGRMSAKGLPIPGTGCRVMQHQPLGTQSWSPHGWRPARPPREPPQPAQATRTHLTEAPGLIHCHVSSPEALPGPGDARTPSDPRQTRFLVKDLTVNI